MSSKLVQRRGPFRRRSYEIIGNELVVEDKTLSGGHTARFQIFDLSENAERQFKRQWGWLVAALVCVLLSSGFVADAVNHNLSAPLVVAGALWAVAALAWLAYFNKSYDNLIFTHWQTGHGLLVLWNNKPNKAEFEAFYNALREKIKATRLNPRLTPEQRLEVYARQLNFLVEEEVLSAEEARKILERKEQAMAKGKANVISIVQDHG